MSNQLKSTLLAVGLAVLLALGVYHVVVVSPLQAELEAEARGSGVTRFNTAVTFRNDVTAERALNVDGATDFDGAVTFDAAATFNGATSLAGSASAPHLSTTGNVTVGSQISVAGSVLLPDAQVGALEIVNISRTVNIPLGSFIDCQTDAGALIGFDTTADALPDYVNSATDGLGFVLRFDDTGSSEDQSSEACAQLTIPPDYISQGEFRVRALKDAHTAATEVINCAVSVNGAALQTAGTVTTSASASTSYTCTPTIAALAVNDSVSFYLSITSDGTMNDIVDVAAVEFVYTASQ
jgi:cytoskeletal protein CcmA (bactofilin family)/predicted HicB family RNase H-like nuclease